MLATVEPSVDGLVPLGLGQLGAVDVTTILVYLLGLSAISVWVNKLVGSADSEHYFLGGRDIPFWAIGLSLFASNLGTDHLVGLAGTGASSGLAVGMYEWSACWVLVMLAWIFVPHYLSCNIYTVPEYLEKRFNRSFRTFFTWLTILATIFTKISVTIFAGAVVLKEVLGWNMWFSSIVLLLLTGIYTAIGGLAAVIYTEVLQSFVLIIGSLALLWFGLVAAGGWSGLRSNLPASYFQVMKPLDDPYFPWTGSLFGMTINGIWYWCTDQVMVQRVLAAKSVRVGQGACILAGWLKILPMFIMVLPGLIARSLFPQEIEQDSNRAFALLVTRLLPPGWQGVMIAVMLSSFMAALASCFNSCSTLFTLDIYVRWVPNHTEAELVKVGRIFTAVLACVSILWLPVIAQADEELFLYIQATQTIWCSPVAVVFLASCLIEEVSAETAKWSLASGLVVGVVWYANRALLPEAWRWQLLATVNILHFAILVFVLDFALLLGLHACEVHAGLVEPRRRLLEDKNDAREEAMATPVKVAAALLVTTVVGMILYITICL